VQSLELDQGSGSEGVSQPPFPDLYFQYFFVFLIFFIFLRYGNNFFIFTLIFSVFNFIFQVNLLL